jgi:hypothetical protein
MRKWYRNDPQLRAKAEGLLKDIGREFGWPTQLIAPLIGRFAYDRLQREEKRLAAGWTYEPKPFRDCNDAALALEKAQGARSREKTEGIRAVTGQTVQTFGR